MLNSSFYKRSAGLAVLISFLFITSGCGFYLRLLGMPAEYFPTKEEIKSKKKWKQEDAALPVLTTTISGSAPFARRIGKGGEIRVKIDSKKFTRIIIVNTKLPGFMDLEGKSVFTITAFKNNQPIKNMDIKFDEPTRAIKMGKKGTYCFEYRGDRFKAYLSRQNKADEVSIKVTKGRIEAEIKEVQSSFTKDKIYSFFLITDLHNSIKNYKLNPGRLCRLSITSDSQDAVESRVKVIFKYTYKNKIDEAEVVLKNGQTKSWEYSKDKGIQSLEIEVSKGGGVKVSIKQPVAKENAAGPKPAPKIADATPWKPVPKSTAEKFTNSLGMEFVFIKPGSFKMGSLNRKDERRHRVTLTKGFYMQATEVTQGQWKAVMGNNPSHFKKHGDNCPVEQVSWNDVQDFIRRLNQKEGSNRYRLPTESEWEYACQAGSKNDLANGRLLATKCKYGTNLDAMGWYCGNSNERTHLVAQKQPNAWGLYDMHGNVWEWCQDRYNETYPYGSVIDPSGPSCGSFRVNRGGSWNRFAGYCRSAYRLWFLPDNRLNYLGFRLAISPSMFLKLNPKSSSKGRLCVGTQPWDAKVRILNIKHRFYQGMDLEAGRYHVEVSARGFKTKILWVNLSARKDKNIDIRLSPEPTPESAGKFTNSLGMEFVYIKQDNFMMGSPSSELGNCYVENLHLIKLTKGFYMQTTEVTQGQWKAVMGSNPSHFKNCGDDCPVETVSWNDAQEFIRKLNKKEGVNRYRLPTEAEWEYAVRAGSTTAFANGEISENYDYDANLDAMGWYHGNSSWKTHRVAGKKPNRWGLYDMHGNVKEWCQDWLEKSWPSSAIDPTGPLSGSDRVYRGGCWRSGHMYCRSAYRDGSEPDDRSFYLGFRLALSPVY